MHIDLSNRNLLIGRGLEYDDVVEEVTMLNTREKDKDLLVTENAMLDDNDNNLFDMRGGFFGHNNRGTFTKMNEGTNKNYFGVSTTNIYGGPIFHESSGTMNCIIGGPIQKVIDNSSKEKEGVLVIAVETVNEHVTNKSEITHGNMVDVTPKPEGDVVDDKEDENPDQPLTKEWFLEDLYKGTKDVRDPFPYHSCPHATTLLYRIKGRKACQI